MIITATDFKTNFEKYLKMVSDEDILITKNGKVVAQLSKPQDNQLAALRHLVGIAANGTDVSLEEIKNERLEGQ